jgi:phosphate transport system substrate-binding protein
MSKLHFLMGVSALIASAAALASPAAAQATTQAYGGGSSLIGPYIRQAEDCYGGPTPLLIESTAVPPGNATDANPPIAFFNYTGTPAQNCATSHVDTSFQLNYISTGSGNGIRALYSHTPTPFWGTQPNGTAFPSVQYGAAETSLGSADVTVYNSGGTEQGQTFGSGGTYPIPQPLYGNLIQFPLLITPVDIAYDAIYKKRRNADGTVTSYHFHVHRPRSDGSGGLVLNGAEYCGIFNGQITNWNDPALQTLNGGVSLKDPADPDPTFSVPITIVGRSDSSGTSSVWTRHLAAECPLVISGNQYADSTSTMPGPLQGPVWTKTNPNFGPGSGVTDVPGKYTLAAGNDGVADYIQFDPNNLPGATAGNEVTQGRMGYVGPDFVLPAVNNTGQNTFGLQSASLLRSGTVPISPTGQKAALAYAKNILPPTGGNQSHPDLWVQAASKTAAIAIPTNINAYPIVGTSNFLGFTCYAAADVTTKMVAFLDWFGTDPTVTDRTLGLLAKAGFAAMPVPWLTAIRTTFIAPNSTTKPLNLYIRQAGTGPSAGTGSQCKAISPGA